MMTPDERREHEAQLKKLRERWDLPKSPMMFAAHEHRVGFDLICPDHPDSVILRVWQWNYTDQPDDLINFSPMPEEWTRTRSGAQGFTAKCRASRCHKERRFKRSTLEETVDSIRAQTKPLVNTTVILPVPLHALSPQKGYRSS